MAQALLLRLLQAPAQRALELTSPRRPHLRLLSRRGRGFRGRVVVQRLLSSVPLAKGLAPGLRGQLPSMPGDRLRIRLLAGLHRLHIAHRPTDQTPTAQRGAHHRLAHVRVGAIDQDFTSTQRRSRRLLRRWRRRARAAHGGRAARASKASRLFLSPEVGVWGS